VLLVPKFNLVFISLSRFPASSVSKIELTVEAHSAETSRIPHFLDNRLIEGGDVVSLTNRPRFTSMKSPGIHMY
jgi:hypothetical protein